LQIIAFALNPNAIICKLKIVCISQTIYCLLFIVVGACVVLCAKAQQHTTQPTTTINNKLFAKCKQFAICK